MPPTDLSGCDHIVYQGLAHPLTRESHWLRWIRCRFRTTIEPVVTDQCSYPVLACQLFVEVKTFVRYWCFFFRSEIVISTKALWFAANVCVLYFLCRLLRST